MNSPLKGLGFSALSLWLLAGCFHSGNGGSSSAPPPGSQPGPLDAGGTGLPIDQIVGANGQLVTANFSSALAVNDNLKVIGFAETSAGSPFTAALWSVNPAGDAVTPRALAPLTAGGFASAFALDAYDNAVGQAADLTARLVAVAWPQGSGSPLVLPALAPAGNYAAYAVSPDGRLVVGEAADALQIPRAVLWKADGAGRFTAAPFVLPVSVFSGGKGPSLYSSGSAIAQVGQVEILVTGEAEDGEGTLHAALWRSVDGGASFVAVDLGADCVASAVNSHRLVVGELSGGPTPVYWAVDALGVPGAPIPLAGSGSARAVNESDRIAGWSGAAGIATVWNGTTPATLFDIPSEAYDLTSEAQPLVAGRIGSKGFLKRIQ